MATYTNANLSAQVVTATPEAAWEAMGITPEIFAQAQAEMSQASFSPQAPQAAAVQLTASHGLQGEAPIVVSMNSFPAAVVPGKKYTIKEAVTGIILNPSSLNGAENGWFAVPLKLTNGTTLSAALTVNQSIHAIGEEVTLKGATFSLDTYNGVQRLSGVVTLPKSKLRALSEDDF